MAETDRDPDLDPAEVRQRYGRVFERLAEDYDRQRRNYPPELVDAVLVQASLNAGDIVLEVGAGTGLLTEQLLERGLHVRAVDAGAGMLDVARRRTAAWADAVSFAVGRFEEVELPSGLPAVVSGTAWHWLDPAVSWRRAHEALRSGGRLCLMQPTDVRSPETAAATDGLQRVFEEVAPEYAVRWPPPRDRATVEAELEGAGDDVSAVWAAVTQYPLQDPSAIECFSDVRIVTAPLRLQPTAEQLNALVRTTSFHARLTPEQRDALEEGHRRLAASLGGTLPITQLYVLVTAAAR